MASLALALVFALSHLPLLPPHSSPPAPTSHTHARARTNAPTLTLTRCEYGDGAVYEGSWFKGKPHGEGALALVPAPLESPL